MSVINQGLPADFFYSLVQNIMETPFYTSHGLKPLEFGLGYAVFELVNPEAANSRGEIHGGLQMACADTAMGNAVRTYGYQTATVEQSTSFLRPAPKDSRIICKGKVVQIGDQIVHTIGELYADDILITYNTGSFFKLGKESFA
jgi:uncharacterized protein (TIGR00369 family)